MSDISFKSTFKIPVSQWGVNNTKKLQMKALIGSMGGKIYGSGKDAFVLVSIKNNKDLKFIHRLKKIGYYEMQKFEGENIKQNKLLEYVQNLIQSPKKK